MLQDVVDMGGEVDEGRYELRQAWGREKLGEARNGVEGGIDK